MLSFKKTTRSLFVWLWVILIRSNALACQCPSTSLSLNECAKYDIIFKGKIESVKSCENGYGEAIFEIEELYKGNIKNKFLVYFECDVPCAQKFQVGEEWIIYTYFKQITNGKMDWCSRSRKYFAIAAQDLYTQNYGNDYEDELDFLRMKLGLHKPVNEVIQGTADRNIKPSLTQMIILLLVSMSCIILFYWLFGKYFKRF
ncbi:MAG: hypothetical protein IPM51_01080 [Sphingobacteriaceae bacterium]|nr:hypothetical protein [Sphingobacteriaceae bacterium]